MPRHLRAPLVGTTAYGVALLLIGLWPTHVDQNIDVTGLPPVSWITRRLGLTQLEAYRLVEVSANVVLFVPLGGLAVLWSRRFRLAYGVLLGLAISAVIEIIQEIARPDRTGSWIDVVANTCGAMIGAAAVVVLRRSSTQRRS